MHLSILILAVVMILIAARGIGRLHIAIWQAMAGGAVAVLVTGQITPGQALAAVDPDVMLFLLGMFIIGQSLVASGYLYCLADRVLARIHSSDGLVLALLLGAALSSALLMNDTLAIIATPLMLHMAREHRLAPHLLLLVLAFAVTIGSVMSPIGNPQNLLIAVRGGLADPFVSFFSALGPPTLVNLILTYGLLRWLFRHEFHDVPLTHTEAELRDPALARLARIALWIVTVLIMARIVLTVVHAGWNFKLSYIAAAGALPLLLISPRRLELVRRIDWHTLIFFIAMFVLMAAVWASGFFQQILDSMHLDASHPAAVMGISIGLSQIISNVPSVALYLPVLQHAGAGVPALMALAAGSTIAGNLLIMGAASNVIIIHNAERAGIRIGYLQFARVGLPVTLLNTLVYWVYLNWWAGHG